MTRESCYFARDQALALHSNPSSREEVAQHLGMIYLAVSQLREWVVNCDNEEEESNARSDLLRLDERREALLRRLEEIDQRNTYP